MATTRGFMMAAFRLSAAPLVRLPAPLRTATATWNRHSFAQSLPIPGTCSASRLYSATSESSVEPPDYLDERELKIFNMIKDELQPTKLEVQDVSGGCGSMYALDIVSDRFKGLPVIKQHRLVNKVLGEEIKKWHGVQLKTKAPPA